jgi:hypothetical protein
MSKCAHCPNEAGTYRDITFSHNGLTLKVFKSGLECEECAKREMIELLERYPGFVTAEKEGVRVNWAIVESIYHQRRSDDKLQDIYRILRGLKLLIFQSRKSWNVNHGMVPCNPRLNGIYAFFAREEDARAWGKILGKGSDVWQS